MAAFGAGLLDYPLGASDWDTDSLLAGADCAGASVGAPRAEQSQSAVDVNVIGAHTAVASVAYQPTGNPPVRSSRRGKKAKGRRTTA